ncbi:MAG: shikimate dehydrogenase family protein, partial [Planctomycetota bacterium]
REIGAVRGVLAAAESDGRPLACFASGRPGAITRLLAPAWGSWGTYGSTGPGAETAEGQFPARDMLDIYDVAGIRPDTKRFALVGSAVFGSPSPAMHGAGYRRAGLDARYFPLELDALDDCLPLVGSDGLLGVEGLAVTMPFKQAASKRCITRDEVAAASDAVNTVLIDADGWSGSNTDGPAAVSLIGSRLALRGANVAIVGAGGTARAAATALARAGAHVILFNRTLDRARTVARSIGAEARALDELASASWDILVQTTPLGARGERVLAPESLTGKLVLDAVYGPQTPLVRDAHQRGLTAIDGFELLVAQAVPQFERLTGARTRDDVLREAGRAWLDSRAT